jgi:hypothetical protein
MIFNILSKKLSTVIYSFTISSKNIIFNNTLISTDAFAVLVNFNIFVFSAIFSTCKTFLLPKPIFI